MKGSCWSINLGRNFSNINKIANTRRTKTRPTSRYHRNMMLPSLSSNRISTGVPGQMRSAGIHIGFGCGSIVIALRRFPSGTPALFFRPDPMPSRARSGSPAESPTAGIRSNGEHTTAPGFSRRVFNLQPRTAQPAATSLNFIYPRPCGREDEASRGRLKLLKQAGWVGL
jgi:hypothetical protein